MVEPAAVGADVPSVAAVPNEGTARKLGGGMVTGDGPKSSYLPQKGDSLLPGRVVPGPGSPPQSRLKFSTVARRLGPGTSVKALLAIRRCRRGSIVTDLVAAGRTKQAATLLAVLLNLCLVVPAAARADAAGVTQLRISGRGLGHGVGMSQWGAEDRARAGQSYRRILGFYYPGTRIGATQEVQVRVLVGDEPRLSVGSGGPFVVADATGRTTRLGAGSHWFDAAGRVDTTQLTLPLTVRPGSAPLTVGTVPYEGTLVLERFGARLRAINMLGLEDYLVGVVSSENPGYWAPAALRAQAVASRTYALANLDPAASFDLYDDNRSQNYHGLKKHFESATRAVASTRGQTLLYGGKPIDAYFSASNGGFTSGVEGVWGAAPLPYLVARPDPFDAKSPVRPWGPVTVGLAKLRAAFPALAGNITSVQIVRNNARRAVTVTFKARDGNVAVPGALFQDRLGLPSTYLSVTPVYGS
jgi:stage II sporulation protein D